LETNISFDQEEHHKISQHNIVEKGLVLFQIMVDPHSVVESTIRWAIDNYIDEKERIMNQKEMM
jgi:hypothetical protein